MVNTILKEADLFCPNSVRINFTIYLNYLQKELELVMQLAGTHNIDEVKATHLVDNHYGN
ncbi:ABC transporter ATP-binding protein [Latilactobacillus curvatus]|nr:ABC transporter ATP-binding protein [Latilactobacillus curvatus]MCS8605256.1 ABC transporter ATP-binding protein [Latilactobacillus curvatus]